MKKSFLLVTLFVFAINLSFAQRPKCLDDVLYALVNLKEVPRAKKYMDDCFPGNESSAEAWLVRANVYIQLHIYEFERNQKDSKYKIRWPEAIVISNESFYKAVELRRDIRPSTGLIDPKDGQLLSAPIIHDMVAEKMNNKDYQEAIKFLNLVIRSYKADPQRFSTNLAIAYLDLANCYKAIGDEDNEKKLLIDAAKLNLAVPVIYLSLYDIYLKENDTIKCGEILTQARKVLPDSLATNVKSYELDYFSMIGDTAKLKNAAMKMYEEFKTEPKVINIIVGHLINIKEYTIAEDMINAGLLIDPNSFELLQQMAYRFYREAYDFEDIKTAKLAERPRKYIEAEAALNKSREIFGTAVIWAEKAYSFNQDDKEHNIIYRQMLVILELPVPDDLNEKVNSYIKQ